MERLKGEMQDGKAPKETGKGSTPLLPNHTILILHHHYHHHNHHVMKSGLFLSVSQFIVYELCHDTIETNVILTL